MTNDKEPEASMDLAKEAEAIFNGKIESVESQTVDTAILAAQEILPTVPKDGWNAYSKYKYTTAEKMIETCRATCHKCGLLVLPESREILQQDVEQGGYTVLRSVFSVVHVASGQERKFVSDYPLVQTERGLPPDKGTSALSTTALSYFYRDLLQVPRGEELDQFPDNVDRQDNDNGQRPTAKPQQPQQQAQVRTEAISLAQKVFGNPTKAGELSNKILGLCTKLGINTNANQLSESDWGKIRDELVTMAQEAAEQETMN